MHKIMLNKKLREILTNSSNEIINLFLEENQVFSVLCSLEGTSFEPKLPEEISAGFRDMTLFTISGYTFQSAFIKDNLLIFEAGFGKENFGSVVSIEIDRIIQIMISDEIMFTNLTASLPKIEEKNSFGVFSNNPKNRKFFKK